MVTLDIGSPYNISRNIEISKNLKLIIPFFIKEPQTKKFLDYGGGYGILVRLMRDVGYDFYWFDKYSQNIFAKGFECKDKIDYIVNGSNNGSVVMKIDWM